ncbi:MAG TPA: nucleoside deaminase [Candidatus Scybalousia intestinigallinarum]|nr:nucleoside deaminase [Candidatus Scybalousia intestinigallinarum]
MNDIDFMMLALKEAKMAYDNGEVPVGAVLVKENQVISSSHNQKDFKNCAIFHAEIGCIIEASRKLNNWRLTDCSLYVTMMPCPMCAGAIAQSRISKVVYGTVANTNDVELVKKIFSNRTYGNAVELVGGILEEESAGLVKDFFREKRS